jgi:hypothetical protein
MLENCGRPPFQKGQKRREFPVLENCGRPPFQKGQRAVTPYICCAGRRNLILCLIWAISLRGKEQRERSLLPSLRPGAGAVHGRAINIYIYFIILSSFLRNLVPTAARRRQTPRRFLGVVRPFLACARERDTAAAVSHIRSKLGRASYPHTFFYSLQQLPRPGNPHRIPPR